MSIRKRVFFLALVILLYPLAGIQFLKENEKQFRETEASYLKDRLIDSEEWIDFLRPNTGFKGNKSDDSLFFSPLNVPIQLDGYAADEWVDIPKKAETDANNEIEVTWQSAVYDESLYLLFSIKDQKIQPQDNRSLLANGDHLGIRLGDNRTYYLRLSKPGKITAYYLNSVDNLINSEVVDAYWRLTKEGYQVEIKINKKNTRGRLGFFVANASDKYKLLKRLKRDGPSAIVANLNTRQRLLGIYPIINTELAPRYQLIDFSLPKILERTVEEREGMRLHVVDKACNVMATAGVLNVKRSNDEIPWLAERFYRLILANAGDQNYRPDAFNCGEVLNDQKLAEVIQNKTVSTYWIKEYQNDLMSYAAMELTIEPYAGYVLMAEQGRDRYVMLTASNFLTFLITLIAISILVVLITFIAMNRWSNRLATLNDNAQRHVDEKGDITGDFDTDTSSDEIGQLSRNFGDLLGQIKNHNNYLKTLAQKLSHEMRTPLAIVSTSLDNIDNKSDSTVDTEANGNDVYLTRARDGIQRLNHIMTAMGQAKKIEQAIEHAELISFDVVELLQEASQSYQSVYDKYPIVFNDVNKAESLTVNASADLMIQMLDKLVDNAVGFSEEGSPVNIHLITTNDCYEIQVINMGSQLPEKDIDGVFQQLVSYRSKGDDKPHLGLGLFIARLITEYHGGTINAVNLDDQLGVSFSVRLPFT